MDALTTVQLPGVPKFSSGKVREIFDLGDELLIVATDRISAFDCVLPTGVPDKGKVLTALSVFWFRFLEDLTEHVRDGGSTKARVRCAEFFFRRG